VANLCAASGLPCGQSSVSTRSTGNELPEQNPRAVQEKNSGHILTPGFPQRNPQAASACLWKKGAGSPLVKDFPGQKNGPVMTVHSHAPPGGGHAEARGDPPVKPPATQARAGYSPPVCSSLGDAVQRITAAIDQLATDVHGQISEPELATRVADLWQMVSDLDPELARRRRGYTASADGTPSA
jgi:hypothetical protein